MAAAAILDFENLKNLTPLPSAGPLFITVQISSKSVKRLRRNRDFSIFPEFLMAGGLRRLILCYHTKFRVDLSNRCKDLVI